MAFYTDPTVIAACATGAATVVAAWIAVAVKNRAKADDEVPKEVSAQLRGWDSLTGHLYKEIEDQRRKINSLEQELSEQRTESMRREADCERRIAALERQIHQAPWSRGLPRGQ